MYEIRTDKVCVGMPNNEEEIRAKKRENQRDRYAALRSDEKDEVRSKKREYQRSHRACLKAEADASKLIAPCEITAQKEEARAKIREYQRERYAAFPNHKKEKFQENNREYQQSHRARLKAETDASKLIASSEITDTRMDDKGNSCKRKPDLASQVDNIGVGKGVYQRDYGAQKKVDKGAFNSGIWEPEDTLHGIEDFKYEYSIESTTRTNGHDPYNFVYVGLPQTYHVLTKVQNYFYCRAKRFEGEGPAFCCRNGRVNIFIPEVPDELRRLFTSQINKDAKYFRRNIR
ncbi:unnamed protein product [Miscanthus lutarioriparius]|uniref:Uncharacterized protein n=1 Tax=Miscanthus lutarioriparius TaxID=422564 RepID=A0A811QKD3_9POAL|nr:unnamed protein product [Miscanthus lutarioriparius]